MIDPTDLQHALDAWLPSCAVCGDAGAYALLPGHVVACECRRRRERPRASPTPAPSLASGVWDEHATATLSLFAPETLTALAAAFGVAVAELFGGTLPAASADAPVAPIGILSGSDLADALAALPVAFGVEALPDWADASPAERRPGVPVRSWPPSARPRQARRDGRRCARAPPVVILRGQPE